MTTVLAGGSGPLTGRAAGDHVVFVVDNQADAGNVAGALRSIAGLSGN